MTLVSCVELDALTVQLTVTEIWEDKRWLRAWRTSVVKTYVLAVRVGRWFDGERYVLGNDPRRLRLAEIYAGVLLNRKLDRAVGLPIALPLLER